MPIIGKLIQRSTAISFKRISRASADYKQQLEALRQNIEDAKKTAFGQQYNFAAILQKANSYLSTNKMCPSQNTRHFIPIG